MAALESLLPFIYHEEQQQGSMLCAQHALNSLLQGNYFTAPDLSEIAQHLDHLEMSYNEDIRGQASSNMDDTGFFSVQVLENALHVWGLSLVRWRSEVMIPNHDRPHAQLAFVLNQNQHWYTLRRFGSSEENGHWFNLDSSKPSPQWIGETYLGMFLQQAERDGYSTFVVVPIDPSNPHPLPRTVADDVASTLLQPSSSGPSAPSIDAGFEDEDMDLQAALQASLDSINQGGGTTGGSVRNRQDSYPSPVIPSSHAFPGFPPEPTSSARGGVSRRQPNIPPNQDTYGNADLDPVSASMERHRFIMERMRREQEMALREQYEDEIAQFQGHHSRTREHEAESDDDDDDDKDDGVPAARRNVYTHAMDRVYDDDDAELQAALKASLEMKPPGFTLPHPPEPSPPQRLTNEPLRAVTNAPSRTAEESEADTETETETETDANAERAGGEAAQSVSIEEIRRRRLARFGG